MEILLGETKTKLITRLLPSSHFYFSSRVLSSTFSSTTQAPSPSSSSTSSEDVLWKRIKNLTDPKAPVVTVLDRWIQEGNTVKKPLIHSLIRFLCRKKRYDHALQLSHWMTNSQRFTLSSADTAILTSLLQRTCESEHVEAYINHFSDDLRTYDDYVTLLCCYVQENSVQKAEAILQEMREKKMIKSPHPYNLLSNLYSRNGVFDKINILVQEMERNGINPDKYTMSNLMAASVASSDISGMEKILDQMNKDPQLVDGWRTYSMAANGYLKVGSVERALTMLRKMEGMMSLGRSSKAFDYLLTQYAKTDRKDEVFRVWNAYKPLVEPSDKSFCLVISSLLQLEDIEGAQRIFEDWESRCTKYDFRVQNITLLTQYKKEILKKAEAAAGKADEGRTPDASTWNILARGYVEQKQMSKAVEMLMRALPLSRKGWKPNPIVLNACLDYLEIQGDVKAMEELIKSLKRLELLTRDIYHKLVRTYIATGKVEDLDRTLMDDFRADEEINKILEKPSA